METNRAGNLDTSARGRVGAGKAARAQNILVDGETVGASDHPGTPQTPQPSIAARRRPHIIAESKDSVG
jgi:hypothetical protein